MSVAEPFVSRRKLAHWERLTWINQRGYKTY